MENLYNYLAVVYALSLGISVLVRKKFILNILCLGLSFLILIVQISLAIYLCNIFGIICLGLTGVIVFRLIISRIVNRND